MTGVEVFDTTLRDGAQLEGISLSVEDKLRIAEQLDRLGVRWIEGGWPGANPKDDEFFQRASKELHLTNSRLLAFGSTRRVNGRADGDPTLNHLLAAGTDAVCIVGKAWDYHVTEALRTTLDEGVAMVHDSVAYLVAQGKTVMLDAEHFFDGFRSDREFSLEIARAAAQAGAYCVVLCDTNGGMLPHQVAETVSEVVDALGPDVRVGIHCHNDTGCAVANSMAAVVAGATHVQGTINGYGERVGNANLCTIIANLELKMGIPVLPSGHLELLTPTANHVAELVNKTLDPQAPYVGSSAFAHKAGLHVSAIMRRSDAYEHVDAAQVGNGTRFLVSEMAGRATIERRAEELGIQLDEVQLRSVLDDLKSLEHAGYHFEAADASLELLLRRAAGWNREYFTLESFRTIDEQSSAQADEATRSEATVKLWVENRRVIETGEGNGPIAALDTALRAALEPAYPALKKVHLTDFRVRVLDTEGGTSAVVRVLIDTTDGSSTWTTIGVSGNVVEASWVALVDAIVYGLWRSERGAVA
jgi:2-isopropylmalate synthase